MDTYVQSPREIFTLSQNFNIPLFQRRYVWKEDDQWAPLWADVRRTAEARESGNGDVRHFLGAIVLQSQGSSVGTVPQWSVIDGQQRLTTLQLLMDAVAAILEDQSLTRLANRLHKLTHNDEDDVSGELLKLRHSNADRAAFDEVMHAPAPVDHPLLKTKNSLINGAHAFFTERARHWLGDRAADQRERAAEALVDTLATALQLVVISLKADEDSQEIFETLNARGTPLQAADLIKNLLFQRLEGSVLSAHVAYREYWRLFETPFWEKEIAVGRVITTRSALFLSQWLVSRVGEDIGPRTFFRRFKHFVDHEYDGSAADLLKSLHSQALTYQGWVESAASQDPAIDVVPLSVYRLGAARIEIAQPLLIWLHEPGQEIDRSEITTAVTAVESWLIRRMILRLTSSDLGRIVARLINQFRGTPSLGLGERIRTELANLSTESTYWPGDDEIREHFRNASAYSIYSAARLRMLLEAVEDQARGFTQGTSKTGIRAPRGTMAIEHVMPRKWQDHWPVADLAAEVNRNAHVNRLGNLTLLTASLNSSVSNAAWAAQGGKQHALGKHDVLLMNRPVIHKTTWDEASIDARTERMTDAVLATWPVPEDHLGLVQTEKSTSAYVGLQEIVASGRLSAGTVLKARNGGDDGLVTEKGWIRYNGTDYESPSGAGKAALGRNVNGWHFWRLEDGRRLVDLRDDHARNASSRATTRERGIAATVQALQTEGWSVTEEKDGNRVRLLAAKNHQQRTVRVSAKTAKDWQLRTSDATPLNDPTAHWAFVDLSGEDPTVQLYREDDVRELISSEQDAYLSKHGGERPVTAGSEHFALSTEQLSAIEPHKD